MDCQSPSISTIIFRPGALGDTLMLIPALAQIHDRKNIALAGRRPGINFLAGHVGSVLDMDQAHWHHLFSPKPMQVCLPFNHAKTIIGFFSNRDSHITWNLHHYYKQATVHIFPSLPGPEDSSHVAWHVANCFQKAGLKVDPDKAIENARSMPLIKTPEQGELLSDYYVVHPGSGSRKKNLSPNFFAMLLSELAYLHFTPVVLLGPAEEELFEFFSPILDSLHSRILLSPKPNELISILGHSRFYIGHDTGITHLSAMLGTPTLAFFKNTNTQHWRPLGPNVHLVDAVMNEKVLLQLALEYLQEIVDQK